MARLLLVVVVVASGCHQTYSGIYWIPDDESIALRELDRKIFEAIRDLGFERVEAGVMVKDRNQLPFDGSRFEGDLSAVSVAVSAKPLAITVRDFSNRAETGFVAELKRRIECHLDEEFGMGSVEFRQQPALSPNS